VNLTTSDSCLHQVARCSPTLSFHSATNRISRVLKTRALGSPTLLATNHCRWIAWVEGHCSFLVFAAVFPIVCATSPLHLRIPVAIDFALLCSSLSRNLSLDHQNSPRNWGFLESGTIYRLRPPERVAFPPCWSNKEHRMHKNDESLRPSHNISHGPKNMDQTTQ
jgi:hypothetical protein